MQENSTQYLLKVAIDYGSTNTITAFCVYERDERGEWILSRSLNPENNVIHIPTIMIFREDNPDNEAVQKDLYGQEAEAAIQSSNEPPVVCDNFKQLLYTTDPGSEGYKLGVERTTLFFRHLRTVYRQRIYNPLPNYVREGMEVVLYLSTPVRGNLTHRSLMKNIAQEAGFTAENGITEICTDYDEARCVVRYAMENARDAMKTLLEKAGKPGGAILMFIDVGGSTMDVGLENLRIDLNGMETMDPISEWPSADTAYSLGGCLVDQAIRDYLIRSGFADPDFTEEKWEHGDGKYRFRKFKEENNRRLAEGKVIEKLGNVGSVCFDFQEGIIPSQIYTKANNKISREIFTEVICKDYIEHIYAAISELFATQRTIPGKRKVMPKDVDAVFLAGAGSQLFFVEDILRSSQLGLTAIQQHPELLFSSWENPSLCCALGALVEQKDVITPTYAAESSFVRLNIYDIASSLSKAVTEDPLLLTPEATSLSRGESSGSCNFLSEQTYRLTDKYQMLPITQEAERTITYTDQFQEVLAFQFSLFRISETGEEHRMGMPHVKLVKREFLNSFLRGVKIFAVGIPGILADAAAREVDSLAGGIGVNSKLKDKVGKALQSVGEAVFPEREVEATVKCAFTLTEHNQLLGEISMESPFYKLENGSFEIAF